MWHAPCSEQVLESLLLSYHAGTIRWHENVYQHPANKQALQKEMRQEQVDHAARPRQSATSKEEQRYLMNSCLRQKGYIA